MIKWKVHLDLDQEITQMILHFHWIDIEREKAFHCDTDLISKNSVKQDQIVKCSKKIAWNDEGDSAHCSTYHANDTKRRKYKLTASDCRMLEQKFRWYACKYNRCLTEEDSVAQWWRFRLHKIMCTKYQHSTISLQRKKLQSEPDFMLFYWNY